MLLAQHITGPVSKPTVTCSVTDSNVTLICEGDESLGDHYRWEGHENQVTNEGKYLTFSKEENHNIEYTCIFSNLKSEERSDRVKNCFVPGGRSHIWVPILVFLAVLAGLIVWGYKYYSRSQGGRSHIWVPILVFLAVLAGLIVWGYKYYSRSQGLQTSATTRSHVAQLGLHTDIIKHKDM
ncbi:hypothetical protein EOD39_12126 [Acipenser ruthenus]|uniref:Uncharacterized protein n=1 Tax=Acipenser ruthenus TaxID=7906 RepID=A0A662YTA6_ACIRT|nr:hypothetical protein EOD39_12126 [Acipenser ruthenus]